MMENKLEDSTAGTAAAFVEQFRAVWAAPTVEGLDALTHPDVRYTQPLLPDVIGRESANQYWRRMFTLIPDLHLDVVNSAISVDNSVYIEFRIKGTLGRESLSLPAVDRYELDDTGRVRRRILYCDSLSMARAVLRPRALAALVHTGIRLGVAAVIAVIRPALRREDR